MRTILAVVVLVAGISPADALACYCGLGLEGVLPEEGDVIPANANLFELFSGDSPPDSTLSVLATGDQIPLTYADTRSVDETARWVIPMGTLPLGTELQWDFGANSAVTFSVTEQIDNTAPVGGDTILTARGGYDSGSLTCGENVWVEVNITEATDQSAVVYEVQVSGDDKFEGDVVNISSFDTLVHIGNVDICKTNYHLSPQDTVFVRSRAIDLAGNASPWSESTSTTVPRCALADNPASASMWLVLLLGAGLRRGPKQR